jgi:Fibronectin type III domain
MAGTGYDSDQAVAALRSVVAVHGAGCLSNAQLLSGELKDFMPNAPRETNILIQAAEAGLPDLLRDRLAQGISPDAALAIAASTVAERTGLAGDATAWAASVTAAVLGLPGATSVPQQQVVQGWQPPPAPVPQPVPPQAVPAQYAPQQDLAGVGAGAQPTQIPDSQPAAQFPATQVSPSPAVSDPQATVFGTVPQQAPPFGAQQPVGGYPVNQPWQPQAPAAGPPWTPAPAPASTGGSGGRRTGVIIGVAVVVIALIVGVVVWAPWKSKAVAAPTGLTLGTVTANSIEVSFTPPATAPNKYEVVENGRVIGHVSGSSTSFTANNLSPATSYSYRLIAVEGSTSSPRSSAVQTTTVTPSVTAAVLDGQYNAGFKVIQGNSYDPYFKHDGQTWTEQWTFTPCQTTGCKTAHLSGVLRGTHFTASLLKLTTDHDKWYGTTNFSFETCGLHNNGNPDPATITILVKATQGGPHGTAWVATAWTGFIKATLRRAYSKSGGSCHGYAVWADLTGTTG